MTFPQGKVSYPFPLQLWSVLLKVEQYSEINRKNTDSIRRFAGSPYLYFHPTVERRPLGQLVGDISTFRIKIAPKPRKTLFRWRLRRTRFLEAWEVVSSCLTPSESIGFSSQAGEKAGNRKSFLVVAEVADDVTSTISLPIERLSTGSCLVGPEKRAWCRFQHLAGDRTGKAHKEALSCCPSGARGGEPEYTPPYPLRRCSNFSGVAHGFAFMRLYIL